MMGARAGVPRVMDARARGSTRVGAQAGGSSSDVCTSRGLYESGGARAGAPRVTSARAGAPRVMTSRVLRVI